MKKLLLITLLICNSLCLFAQSGAIKGRVVDSKTHQPIEYASAAIFKGDESSPVAGAVSKADGSFELSKLSAGN